jgi:recombination protein RecA
MSFNVIMRAGCEEKSCRRQRTSRRRIADGVLNLIERNYGRGSILKLGDAGSMVVETISSGALTLDAALGGGFPKGRVVEIYGPESSGKTTLALHAIAESQKMGGTAAFVDAEHALDPAYGTCRMEIR